MAHFFVTGGTGYIGRPLIGVLHGKGHRIHALVRPGSEARLPAGAVPVIGDALDESTFASAIPPGATLIHLVGTAHPNPAKAEEFRRVDLASIRAATAAAQRAGVEVIGSVLYFVVVTGIARLTRKGRPYPYDSRRQRHAFRNTSCPCGPRCPHLRWSNRRPISAEAMFIF